MPKRHWLWNLLFPQKDIPPSPSPVAEMEARGDVMGLINVLKGRDYSIRGEAVQALMVLGDIAIGPVISLLEDKAVTHSVVAGILAKSRDIRAIEALCRLLNDEDGYVQLVAEDALEKTPDARAVAPLIQAVQEPKASTRVQSVLAHILDQTAEAVPSEVLRQAVQLSDSYVLIFAQVDTSCTFRTYNVTREETDFTQIKQMARQELIRRGLEA